MSFNEFWYHSNSYPHSKDYFFDMSLAKAAWNAAIEDATALVREKFDELEAWLTPEEMEKLKA